MQWKFKLHLFHFIIHLGRGEKNTHEKGGRATGKEVEGWDKRGGDEGKRVVWGNRRGGAGAAVRRLCKCQGT